MLVITMSMLNTLPAGRSTREFSSQVAFQSSVDRPVSACGRCYSILFEELDGSPAHAAAEHHIRLLFINEARHLSWLVGAEKGVGDHLYSFDIVTFKINNSKVWAAPKVMRDHAIQSIIGFNRYSNSHFDIS